MFSGATTARLAALYAGAVEATILSTPQSFKASRTARRSRPGRALFDVECPR